MSSVEAAQWGQWVEVRAFAAIVAVRVRLELVVQVGQNQSSDGGAARGGSRQQQCHAASHESQSRMGSVGVEV